MHLARYDDVVVFDQATKIVYLISWVHLEAEVRHTSSRYARGKH